MPSSATTPEIAKANGGTKSSSGLFSNLKKQLDAGSSPSPALASQLPAPSQKHSPENDADQGPVVNSSALLNDSSQRTSNVTEDDLLLTTSESLSTVTTVTPSSSRRRSTGTKQKLPVNFDVSEQTGVSVDRISSTSGKSLQRNSKSKQKLGICPQLAEELAPRRSSLGGGNTIDGDDRPNIKPRAKTILPVAKELREDQGLVGIKQTIPPNSSIHKEQKRAEEEALHMLERDLQQLQKDEDRAATIGQIKSFFSDKLPSLFDKKTPVTLADELAKDEP